MIFTLNHIFYTLSWVLQCVLLKNVKTLTRLNAVRHLFPKLCRCLLSPCCVPAAWRTYALQGSSCIAPRYIICLFDSTLKLYFLPGSINVQPPSMNCNAVVSLGPIHSQCKHTNLCLICAEQGLRYRSGIHQYDSLLNFKAPYLW